MAITIGNTSNATAGASNTRTFSHTSNSNFLVVMTGSFDSGASGTVSGVTYNGVAMTKAKSQTRVFGGSDTAEASIWYLASPAQGANNVVVTWSASVEAHAGAVSLIGVDTGSALDATTGTGADTGTPLTTLTTGVDDAVIIDAIWDAAATLGAPTQSGQTEIWNTGTGGNQAGGSYRIVGDAGSYNMGWDMTGANGYTYALASFKPAPLGGSFILSLI